MWYDLYLRLWLQFDVLLMMGSIDGRNMYSKFALMNTCICCIFLDLINIDNRRILSKAKCVEWGNAQLVMGTKHYWGDKTSRDEQWRFLFFFESHIAPFWIQERKKVLISQPPLPRPWRCNNHPYQAVDEFCSTALSILPGFMPR